MRHDHRQMSRRAFLKRTSALPLSVVSARGVYGLLESFGAIGPSRVMAVGLRRNEQYLVDGLEIISDNSASVIIPPIYHDVITAQLAVDRRWDARTLKSAQARLEDALSRVEALHAPTAAGRTLVVG